MTLPTRHAPQSLDTPINIALAVEQHLGRVLDGLALSVQIRKSARPDGLRLVRQRLAGLEALRAPVEPVRSGEELLPLLELHVVRVVCVAPAEEGGAVLGQRAQLAAVFVEVGLVVSVSGVGFCAVRGRDVGSFELHLAELDGVWLASRVCASIKGIRGENPPAHLPPRAHVLLGRWRPCEARRQALVSGPASGPGRPRLA